MSESKPAFRRDPLTQFTAGSTELRVQQVELSAA